MSGLKWAWTVACFCGALLTSPGPISVRPHCGARVPGAPQPGDGT